MDFNEFKKQPFYKRLELWMDSLLIEDFYTQSGYIAVESPDETSDGKVNLIWREEEFDAEGLENEKKSCFELAQELYEIEKKHIMEGDSTIGVIKESAILKGLEQHSSLVIYGLVFCIFIADLPEIKKWKYLYIKHYEEFIGKCFREVSAEHEWLEFYITFQTFLYDDILPENLRINNATYYFRRLKEEGFLNSEYKFREKFNQKTAIQEYIASKFNSIVHIPYKDLQLFWGVANLSATEKGLLSLKYNLNDRDKNKLAKYVKAKQDMHAIDEIFQRET